MRDKIIRYKKLILGLVIYILFLGWILFTFSGSPSENISEIYKGVPIGVGEFSSTQAQGMKEDGLNTVRTTMFWMIDEDGNFHEVPIINRYIIAQIQTAHRRGFKVFVELRAQYGGFTSPQGIPEKVHPIFFPQLTQKVLEWATICEKYGVALFAPIQECEVLVKEIEWDNGNLRGYQEISDWGQEILPLAKERYKGELVYGGGAWGGAYTIGPGAWEWVRDNLDLDFTGYDYIGFGTLPSHVPGGSGEGGPIDDYRKYVRDVITTLDKWAQEDGCKGVICRETKGVERYHE